MAKPVAKPVVWGGPRTDAELVRLLARGEDADVRRELQRRLLAEPARLAWALREFARERSAARLGAWARLLGRIPSARVRLAVTAMVVDPRRSPESRVAALRVLERHRSREAVPALLRVIRHARDPQVLAAANQALESTRVANDLELVPLSA